MSSKPVIIAIEGNIGAGKSTLLEKLQEKIYGINTSTDLNILFMKEPVELWQTIVDKNGEDILSKFYDNAEKYSFPFQIMAYSTRLAKLKEAVKHPNIDVIICERSLEADRNVFAKMLADNGKIEDIMFNIYNRLYHDTSDEFQMDGIVYLNTAPEVCHKRVQKRHRDGEAGISVDYLTQCQTYYDKWLIKGEDLNPTTHLLELNCDADVKYDDDEGNIWIESILRFASQMSEKRAIGRIFHAET